ncbi:site-specific DNA-methyltransferase [Rhodoferax antarcticus]|uniref:site-specific DNA-methyltransferase n=1 Tax=Rhodoferax antarcticus TaxID=81479 RepID=UPI0022240335|nr:site-specific DNA-methyltransferase [Rhodoferax antarcticus]MCW2312755.1 adenine-specific DNA-methyltransferase [Rhodoferax antarcticus]
MPTLDWLNRSAAFTTAANVPYRLLDAVATYGSGPGTTDNLLIQGDNLEALKGLLPFYRGQVKCIFIDPPYNTQSAFEHYDDNLEHAQWLSMMLPRLQLLRELLRDDGSIWVTIDDNEGHYLKVLMDEVFGRGNFVATATWQKTTSVHNNAEFFSSASDQLQVHAKNRDHFLFNRIPRSERNANDYSNPDNDHRGSWSSSPLHVSLTSGQRGAQYARSGTSTGLFPMLSPGGAKVYPPAGRAWAYSEETLASMESEKKIWWGKDGSNQPRLKRFLSEQLDGVVPTTIWLSSEVGHNQEAKAEMLALRGSLDSELFATPKPERLIQRILHIATNPRDLVLDSFLGSGTTAAVAHKMGRRWIGIEMGEHAATHCLPRLQKVIDGEQGGISKAVGWGQNTAHVKAANGSGELFEAPVPWQGGGFRFMQLGAPVFDAQGRIHPDVRFATLAAFIWQQETGHTWTGYPASPAPCDARQGTPYLGTHSIVNSYLRISDKGSEPISALNGSDSDGATQPSPQPAHEGPGSTGAPQPTDVAHYLLFNGILGDKRPAGGNVLTRDVLDALLALHASTPSPAAPLLVYGEACRLGPARLALANVTFKHIPYDVRAR